MRQQPNTRRRAGADAILARIARDPAFRQQLRAAPAAALAALGDAGPEVVGYGKSCKWTCSYTASRSCIITKIAK